MALEHKDSGSISRTKVVAKACKAIAHMAEATTEPQSHMAFGHYYAAGRADTLSFWTHEGLPESQELMGTRREVF